MTGSICQNYRTALKTVTGSRPKNVEVSQATVSLSEPSVNHALDLRSIQLFWIAWRLLIDMTYNSLNWMGPFHSNLRKISDCWSFSDLAAGHLDTAILKFFKYLNVF